MIECRRPYADQVDWRKQDRKRSFQARAYIGVTRRANSHVILQACEIKQLEPRVCCLSFCSRCTRSLWLIFTSYCALSTTEEVKKVFKLSL